MALNVRQLPVQPHEMLGGRFDIAVTGFSLDARKPSGVPAAVEFLRFMKSGTHVGKDELDLETL
jgi:hypothetical protein